MYFISKLCFGFSPIQHLLSDSLRFTQSISKHTYNIPVINTILKNIPFFIICSLFSLPNSIWQGEKNLTNYLLGREKTLSKMCSKRKKFFFLFKIKSVKCYQYLIGSDDHRPSFPIDFVQLLLLLI